MADHNAADDRSAQELLEEMDPAARARGEEELAHVEPGASEPLHFGGGGVKTQLSEDPISEVNPFQESLP